MTYSKWIHFLQMIPKDGSPREVPGDGMCFPHGKSPSDRHDLPNAICITHQRIYMISLVLYAPLTKRYMWSPQCYMYHSPWDRCNLPSAICILSKG